jgi:hypothetical protein
LKGEPELLFSPIGTEPYIDPIGAAGKQIKPKPHKRIKRLIAAFRVAR